MLVTLTMAGILFHQRGRGRLFAEVEAVAVSNSMKEINE
jgi:hypothetical protein